MFQYEYEKRPPSATSCDSRATVTTDWSRVYPAGTSRASGTAAMSSSGARRPLPPRPIVCERIPTKPTVPLKVWVIASASCFAVCAALVLATLMITKWGAGPSYSEEMYSEPEQIFSDTKPTYSPPLPSQVTTTETQTKQDTIPLTNIQSTPDTIENDLHMSILEKLPIFKNVVSNRGKSNNLSTKPQIHPLHETIDHIERKIEKKDQAKLPNDFDNEVKEIPEFKPTLPDVIFGKHKDIILSEGFLTGFRKHDTEYEEYYNDDNLYDDYMQSNTMTNYLIEKVQELHNWITTDPDFEARNSSKVVKASNQFGELLKALNESLVEGNVTIIMNKLRSLYFGEDYTSFNRSRRIVSSNSTDLLSFGILSLDVMLLHNIQLMAWESQEAARSKMLKDPDVFAFNALFLDPTKVEAKQNEVMHHNENSGFAKRQNLRQEFDDFDVGKSILENFLEIGMSTARAAIHLGRAYKNTKNVINHIATGEPVNQPSNTNHLSRNIEGNTVALNHLQSFSGGGGVGYTELDCVWLLYCRNLVLTAKLNAPYGTMARINGMALRMLTGELPADRALDTMLYEVFSGWTELNCNNMFPRCSRADAATVVLNTILQPLRKSHSSNKMR
ncbi:uncharacterized protein LOC113518521 [Galleria mellonella]|uniref:Uncharacterized protein LOC113518521 n=1 Tax=Galleria mellonella TaxID=7137 RepID=A0A6J3C4V7_GALME|nr:uncharacterized protein LOC113518521 [Galleria mellonella]